VDRVIVSFYKVALIFTIKLRKIMYELYGMFTISLLASGTDRMAIDTSGIIPNESIMYAFTSPPSCSERES